MRKIRDVLRLSAAGLSKRKIAASLGISATAAGDCLRRAGRAGVVWPLPEGIPDEILEARLYPAATAIAAMSARRPRPDWAAIHRELRRPGVLQAVDAQHRRERKWPTPSLWAEPGIVRVDQRFELRPRHHGRHLGEKNVPLRPLLLPRKIERCKAQLIGNRLPPRINDRSVPRLRACSEVP